MKIFRRRFGLPEPTHLERKEQRNSTFMIVDIMNDEGARLVKARLRDLSANGALLHLETDQAIPDTIMLHFPADRISKAGRVRWRDQQFIGVEFDDPLDLPERMRSRKDRLDVVTSHMKSAGFSDQNGRQKQLPKSA